MEIKYFAEDITIVEIENLTGLSVDELSVGRIETGEYIDEFDPAGNPIKVPVKRKGIQIKFSQEPTSEQLDKLDIALVTYKRDGGKNISDRISDMEARIKILESKTVRSL